MFAILLANMIFFFLIHFFGKVIKMRIVIFELVIYLFYKKNIRLTWYVFPFASPISVDKKYKTAKLYKTLP